MKAVADALEVARSHLHEKVRRLAKPRGSYRKPDDGDLLPLIRRLVDERPTYGYRRITALANRELHARLVFQTHPPRRHRWRFDPADARRRPRLRERSSPGRRSGPSVVATHRRTLPAAAEGSAEIEACTQQIEHALFLQVRWMLPAHDPIRLEGTMRARGRHEGNEHHRAVKMIVKIRAIPSLLQSRRMRMLRRSPKRLAINTPRIGFPVLREPIRSYQIAFRHGS